MMIQLIMMMMVVVVVVVVAVVMLIQMRGGIVAIIVNTRRRADANATEGAAESAEIKRRAGADGHEAADGAGPAVGVVLRK